MDKENVAHIHNRVAYWVIKTNEMDGIGGLTGKMA